MTKSENTKSKTAKHQKQMLVRFGKMGFLGWFRHNENNIPKPTKRVIIKTERGLEMGEIVGPHCYRGGHFKSSCEEVSKYFQGGTKGYPMTGGGSFVRFAEPEDLMEEKHLETSAKDEVKCCQKFAKELDLDMKIVDGEHLFGGERVVLYFTSNGRVDFRELVKRLAKEYQTRIELRQVGARDEARLISDYESCGQECCCKRFLKVLEPVNMRMAKIQKATLDPSKISGHCGRLKCCLRYEDAIYRELKERLPRKNTIVKTSNGEGRVVDVQILTQLVVVQDANGKKEAFGLEDIEIIKGKDATAGDRGQGGENKHAKRARRPEKRGPVKNQRNGKTNVKRASSGPESKDDTQTVNNADKTSNDSKNSDSDNNNINSDGGQV